MKTKFKAFARENEPLFFAEAPAGYPNKNSNNRKIMESARGTMRRGKNFAPSSLSPPHCQEFAFIFNEEGKIQFLRNLPLAAC